MPTFYGNMRGTSGVPSTKALNRVEAFPPITGEQNFTISGVTRDSTGAVLVSCKVELFDKLTDLKIAETISDSVSGAYIFYVTPGRTNYAVAYKVGAPDVAGTTVDTLVGV